MPSKPPEFDINKLAECISKSDGTAADWHAILSAAASPLLKGKYVHWDKLKHLKPPGTISAEQWWFGIKFSRFVNRKDLPLKGIKGGQAWYVMIDSIHESLRQIDVQAGGTMGAGKQQPSHTESKKYLIRSLVEEAITSSQLEGATTTRSDAVKMLRERRPPRTKSEQMILNNYFTMENVRENSSQKLDKQLVCDLHRIITEGTLDSNDQAGRFRNEDEPNWVEDVGTGERLHTPPPSGELDERIERMCQFANGEEGGEYIHPVLRSIILHFWLAFIHPFVDGNGRCARALFYWCMLRNGYWITEYLSISHYIKKAPAKYRTAYLHTETDDNDLTYFIVWHLEVILNALKGFNAYVDRKIEETAKLSGNLSAVRGLNYRQRELVGHALRHPGTEYTTAGHKNSHGVTRQTARKDLEELVQKGYFSCLRSRRPIVYFAADDLKGLLLESKA